MTAPAASRTITVVAPLPPKDLSPNARVDPRTKARAVANYRVAVGYVALAAVRRAGMAAPFARASVAIRYVVCATNPLGVRGRAQPIDADNCIACLKSALDGVRDGGLLVDDTADRLAIGDVALERHRKGRCPTTPCAGSRVEMTFTEASA